MFAMTSGTTASRKFIPVTDQYLADYKRGLEHLGAQGLSRSSRSPLEADRADVGRLAGIPHRAGIPCGSRHRPDRGHANAASSAGSTACPAVVGKVKDPAAKNYLALRLSVPRKVGMIIAANPSTLVNLARAGDQEKETLLRDMQRRHAEQPLRHSRRRPRRRGPPHPQALSREGPRARGDHSPHRHALSQGLLADGLRHRQLDGRQRRRLSAAFPEVLRHDAGSRCRPHRQRRPDDHPDGRRHAQRRSRRHVALLRVHPRGGGRQPEPDRAGRS